MIEKFENTIQIEERSLQLCIGNSYLVKKRKTTDLDLTEEKCVVLHTVLYGAFLEKITIKEK